MSTSRVSRFLLITALLIVCWLAMQVVHELGHVVTAWMTGGRVTALVLHPLAISRTDVSPNPRALAVVWGGPIVGTLGPLLAWLLFRWRHWPSAYLWRFFAGFCCVANGAYIGLGIINPVGDAAELLRLGSPAWSVGGFGLVVSLLGFFLWNGEGKHFGLGPHGRMVSKRHVIAVIVLLVLVVVSELVWSDWTGFR